MAERVSRFACVWVPFFAAAAHVRCEPTLADQPLIAPALIPSLIETHRTTLAPIVAPRHKGRRGNPVLFDRAAWPELMELTGDTGGRPLFEKYAGEVEWVEADEGVLMDVDTEEDYARLKGSEAQGSRGAGEQGR